MIRIGSKDPQLRFQPQPRPESSIGLSRRSIEGWAQNLGGIFDSRLLSVQTFLPDKDLIELKNEFLQALRSQQRFNDAQLNTLEHAFDFMIRFHGKEVFPDGERVSVHLMGVARTLAEWGGDPAVVAAGLLHLSPQPELEKAEIDSEVIALIQRKKVLASFLYRSLGKKSEEEKLTEHEGRYLFKMCLMEEGDINVWLLEAADAFKTLSSIAETDTSTKLTASRTYHVLPIALRLFGFEKIAMKVEDIAFLRLDKEGYERIEALITDTNKLDRFKALEHLRLVTDLLGEELTKLGIKHRIEIDVKSVVSTKKKIKRGEELTDPSRFRIIIEGLPPECKDVADSVIGDMRSLNYEMVASESKNFVQGITYEGIENPGPKEKNDYQSLHLHFKGKKNEPLNVQIRTEEMHTQAEVGSAAHGRFKQNGLAEDIVWDEARSLRQTLIEEGRRYAIFAGKIHRIIPYPPRSDLKLYDLAFAIAGRGLHCPDFVQLERINVETGETTKSKVSVFSPLRNGDKIFFTPAGKPILSGRLKKASSIPALVTLELARKGALDESAMEIESAEAERRGKAALDILLSEEENALRTRFVDILEKEGRGGLPIKMLHSLHRVAKELGAEDELFLQQAIGLAQRDREKIINSAREILRTSSSAVAYKIEGGYADLWIMVYGVPGVLKNLMLLLGDEKLEIINLDSFPLANHFSLIKARVQVRGRKEGIDENILSFLGKAEDLYQRLSLPPAGEYDEVKAEFYLNRMTTSTLIEISQRIHDRFKSSVNIVKASFPTIHEGKALCCLHLMVSRPLSGDLDKFHLKLMRTLYNLRGLSGLNIPR